jgi:hypothetical protein
MFLIRHNFPLETTGKTCSCFQLDGSATAGFASGSARRKAIDADLPVR